MRDGGKHILQFIIEQQKLLVAKYAGVIDAADQTAELRLQGMVELLIEQFSSFSMHDVEKAFQKACAGKLDGVDIKAYYARIDATTFGKMLSAYEKAEFARVMAAEAKKSEEVRKRSLKERKSLRNARVEERKEAVRKWFYVQVQHVQNEGCLNPEILDMELVRAALAYSKTGNHPNLDWDYHYSDKQTTNALLRLIKNNYIDQHHAK